MNCARSDAILELQLQRDSITQTISVLSKEVEDNPTVPGARGTTVANPVIEKLIRLHSVREKLVKDIAKLSSGFGAVK